MVRISPSSRSATRSRARNGRAAARVIPRFYGRRGRWVYAAILSFRAGVMPPLPMSGCLVLQDRSHPAAICCTSPPPSFSRGNQARIHPAVFGPPLVQGGTAHAMLAAQLGSWDIQLAQHVHGLGFGQSRLLIGLSLFILPRKVRFRIALTSRGLTPPTPPTRPVSSATCRTSFGEQANLKPRASQGSRSRSMIHSTSGAATKRQLRRGPAITLR